MDFIRNKIFLLLFVPFIFAGCTEEGSDSSETEEQVIEEGTEEVSRGLEESALRPELVGKWKQVDMRMDNQPLPQLIAGDNYLEFLPNGTVALSTQGFDADTAGILQNGDMLMSDIWDEALRIDSLTMNRLILSEIIDGDEVSYIYSRE